ncbi:MAG: histidine--tRNA ligase, partial [Methanobacteriota archaeon]
MKIENPKGTRDFTPTVMRDREYVEKTMSNVLEGFNFEKISTPIFEYSELFELKSGEDIKNRMYTFDDKGGRKLCLRPELTASVARMFSNELRNLPKPLRLYYFGPMFRYEEPQKGRYREFYQLGVELLGVSGVFSDALAIYAACECLKRLGLEFELQINSLGVVRGLLEELGVDDKVSGKLITLLDEGKREGVKEVLDDEIFERLIKISGGKKSLGEAEKVLKGFDKALAALSELRDLAILLDSAGIAYTIDFGIVRGLDYYTGTVFEIRVSGLGAQNQICGGGRYDNLIEVFGGPKTPAVGFAFGFDRVCEALILQSKLKPPEKKVVVVASVSGKSDGYAIKVAGELVRNLSESEFIVDLDVSGRKLKKTLEQASNMGSGWVVIVWEKEEKEKMITLRDMEKNSQKTVT